MSGTPEKEANVMQYESDDFVFRLLRSVLSDTQVKDTRMSLALILKELRHRLTIEAFQDLFDVDTTFGMFGMPVAQYDSWLNVVALTAFQPYDERILKSGEDVITLLTPIYRILSVLALITLHLTEFEGFTSNIEDLLPYKPRTQFATSRYSSLLDVACSVWTEVCHAYVSRETRRIHELYCFNVSRTRAHSVWLDICVEKILPHHPCTSDWITLKGTTLKKGSLTIVLEGECTTVLNSAAAGAVTFARTERAPYVDIISCEGDYFLLLTFDGGHYSSFFRSVGGTLVAYPLCLHRLPIEESRLYDASPTFSRVTVAGGENARLFQHKCCVCAKTDVPLSRNEWDNTPDGETRLYCSKKCIQQMVRIQQDRARAEEARLLREESARKQFPSSSLRSGMNNSF
jgi:hypothetical protein